MDAGAARPRLRALIVALAALPAVLLIGACGPSGEATGETSGGPRRVVGSGWPVDVELGNAPPRHDRVVLLTIDTLRVDHVSCYGYRRPTTPFLDRLAREGALFERAMSTISHTAPSHTSLLTGLPPLVHGVLQNGYRLDENAVDLARAFGEAGFRTAAFVNTEFLAGVTTHFQHAEATTERGEAVVNAANAWLAGVAPEERVFLWVHLFDPHRWKDFAVEVPEGDLWPGPPEPGFFEYVADLHGLGDRPAEKVVGQVWNTVGGKEVRIDDVAQFLRFVDAYDALIQYSDRQARRLVQALEERFPTGRTLLVVTADHGEGLASHGIDGHGAHIYQEQLHVPLVVWDSDRGLGGRRVDRVVSHLDVFPTLLATLGAHGRAPDGLLDGRSLWPLLEGSGAGWTPRAVFAQRKPGLEPLYALQDQGSKLLLRAGAGAEFYDLERDPRELDDLSSAGGPTLEALHRELGERLERFLPFARGEEGQEIPADWMQELRDLGYAR